MTLLALTPVCELVSEQYHIDIILYYSSIISIIKNHYYYLLVILIVIINSDGFRGCSLQS